MRQSLLKHNHTEDQQETALSIQTNAPGLTLDALYHRLHSSPAGLVSGEARKRLKDSGPNEPTTVERGAQGLWQRDEVPVDGDEFQLRQYVQHGRRVHFPAVSTHAAHADPAE